MPEPSFDLPALFGGVTSTVAELVSRVGSLKNETKFRTLFLFFT